MNRKIKYSMPSIGVIGVLFGRILNRELTHYFGNNASNIIVAGIIAFDFCIILLSIVMKQYITAVGLFIGLIPFIVSGIGLYIDNMEVVGLSLLLIFIIYPIMIIEVKKFRNKS